MRAARGLLVGVAVCLVASAVIDTAHAGRYLATAVALGVLPWIADRWYSWHRRRRHKRREDRRRFESSVPLYSTDLHGAEEPRGITLEILVVFVLCIAVAVVLWVKM